MRLLTARPVRPRATKRVSRIWCTLQTSARADLRRNQVDGSWSCLRQTGRMILCHGRSLQAYSTSQTPPATPVLKTCRKQRRLEVAGLPVPGRCAALALSAAPGPGAEPSPAKIGLPLLPFPHPILSPRPLLPSCSATASTASSPSPPLSLRLEAAHIKLHTSALALDPSFATATLPCPSRTAPAQTAAGRVGRLRSPQPAVAQQQQPKQKQTHITPILLLKQHHEDASSISATL